MNGKLYALSTGPGAPDLITVRAARILGSLDILYAPAGRKGGDSLALSIVRDYLGEQTEVRCCHFPMSADGAEKEAVWNEVAAALTAEVEAGKQVGFITLGDAMLFSTWIFLLQRIGCPEWLEIVPGVPVLGVMPWLDVDLEDEDGVALQNDKYRGNAPRDITIAIVQLPHISNFTDFNALAAQPDVRIRYIRRPEALADVDLVILPGSKNTLSDLAWLRESGMADAVLQTHRQGVPVMGICGGYQMLGDTIVDEVESGLGTQPGLGLLNTITRFAQDKTTTQVNATMSGELPGWLAAAAGLPVRGYEIHMGETVLQEGCCTAMTLQKNGCSVADGAVTADGLAFGTYLHGLFDSDAFTRAVVNGLRARKGLAPWETTFCYADHKARQFDLLAEAMRQHIDIDKIYTIMQQHQEPV